MTSKIIFESEDPSITIDLSKYFEGIPKKYQELNLARLQEKLAIFVDKIAYSYDGETKFTPNSEQDMKTIYKDTLKLIEKLNDTNIPWKGHVLNFKDELKKTHGVLKVSHLGIFLTYIDKKGKECNEKIPLIVRRD